MGPGVLSKVLNQLPKQENKNLVCGFENNEDAAVYATNDETYLISTVDFFMPNYKDAYTFGQITAANALSDVFAMGGEVLYALNILGFPNCIDSDVVAEILKGATDKVNEAGAVIVGGHSIVDKEIKYGLAVTGQVKKDKLKTNDGAKPNQKIILTKPIGTGIYSKEINQNSDLKDCQDVIKSMTTLNKKAAIVMNKYNVTSATDITGFGLAGHLCEVLKASKINAKLNVLDIPLFERTFELCIKYANGGMKRNLEHFGKNISFELENDMNEWQNIVFDPQTSGGLLMFVDDNDADKLLKELHDNGIMWAKIIGNTFEGDKNLATPMLRIL